MSTIHLTITTPEKIFFEGDISILTLKIADGYIGILPNMVPIFSNIEIGTLIINSKNSPDSIKCYIGSGIIYTDGKKINIITDDIIKANEIDLERAKKDFKLYENEINKAKSINAGNIQKIELKLKKALNRIDVYKQFNN
ncbi:ATP synthase F1 subunit epsilon [Mycoplasmopsis cricetuli]|uniref:ATP synthase F1 subunit epsilon n=1 Tax=Mycoplasmopsis cricetuli TaxID=171283 RepID=UPI000470C206|nr:ATP synthase F1 subunit epsilon [Mycoplasmopsis cricetuli]